MFSGQVHMAVPGPRSLSQLPCSLEQHLPQAIPAQRPWPCSRRTCQPQPGHLSQCLTLCSILSLTHWVPGICPYLTYPPPTFMCPASITMCQHTCLYPSDCHVRPCLPKVMLSSMPLPGSLHLLQPLKVPRSVLRGHRSRKSTATMEMRMRMRLCTPPIISSIDPSSRPGIVLSSTLMYSMCCLKLLFMLTDSWWSFPS